MSELHFQRFCVSGAPVQQKPHASKNSQDLELQYEKKKFFHKWSLEGVLFEKILPKQQQHYYFLICLRRHTLTTSMNDRVLLVSCTFIDFLSRASLNLSARRNALEKLDCLQSEYFTCFFLLIRFLIFAAAIFFLIL